jgi:hypothetical protein
MNLIFCQCHGLIRQVLESHDHLTLELSAKPFVSTTDSTACFYKKPSTGAPPCNMPGLGRLSHSADYFDTERYLRCDNCNWSTGISPGKLNRQLKEGGIVDAREQKPNGSREVSAGSESERYQASGESERHHILN